ncbi:hypothetical protein ACOMHN_041023 [Nucella lapillus]
MIMMMVVDDTSGDYRNSLLALVVGGPPPEMAAKSGEAFVEAVKAKTEEELDEDVKLESEPVQEDPTLVPYEAFNAEQDCEALKKAMKGFGTDEAAIIEVLSKRSGEQRREINTTYKTMFGKDLGKELSSELSGNFKTLCVEMLLGPAEFDAKQIKKAVKGLGTDERALIEIICTRTNAQLTAMKEAYKTMRVIRSKATQFANELHRAMKGLGTDDDTLVRVVASRCEVDMVQIKEEFQRNFKQSLYAFIVDDTSGDYRLMLCNLIGQPYKKCSSCSSVVAKTLCSASLLAISAEPRGGLWCLGNPHSPHSLCSGFCDSIQPFPPSKSRGDGRVAKVADST